MNVALESTKSNHGILFLTFTFWGKVKIILKRKSKLLLFCKGDLELQKPGEHKIFLATLLKIFFHQSIIWYVIWNHI